MLSLFTRLSVLLLTVSAVLSVTVSAQASTAASGESGKGSIVMDRAEMFSPAEEAALIDTITTNYQKYGLFFAVETITTLDGQPLETVALNHANELGVGDANKDNGVFILLSRDDRQIRFELGTGVNALVSDAEMTNIIASEVTPHFKNGSYPTGIESGMTAVGAKYIESPLDTKSEHDAQVQGMVALFWIAVGIFLLISLIRHFGGESAEKRRKDNREYWEHKEAIDRLQRISTHIQAFKHSDEAAEYQTLPDEVSRLDYLKLHYSDFATLLQKHFSNRSPTSIVDRSFYDDTYGIPIGIEPHTTTPNPLRHYMLMGKGLENMSIELANQMIRTEKMKISEAKEKERQKKVRARKIWESIPESTRTALKKSKNQKDRIALLSGQNANDFSANYALIASMFLSNSSSYSGSSSSSNSSRSSSSSSSSSSSDYSSGSSGGGSFDGGGGSGSW